MEQNKGFVEEYKQIRKAVIGDSEEIGHFSEYISVTKTSFLVVRSDEG